MGENLITNYPCLFRDTIMYTAQDLWEAVEEANGKIPCTVSLYGFTQVKNKHPIWESGIYNKILIECNAKEALKLTELYPMSLETGMITDLPEKYTEYYYFGKDQFYVIINFKEPFPYEILTDYAMAVYEEIEKILGIKVHVNYYSNKMILYPNTFNPDTERFVIQLYSTLEILNDEELKTLDEEAKKQRFFE